MSYQALFYPQAVAMIGASRRKKTVGNDIVKNLVEQGYQGKIYPVNPKADELYGKKVYASILDVPSEVDLAIIAVPAKYVLPVLKEAHQKGAQAAIVISAGFKEVGEIELEEKLAKYCQKEEITLVGPNCLGILNPEENLNASFATHMPAAGDIAFVSQSGALCTAVIDYAEEIGIGFSKFLSIGNKATLDELDLIKYFAQDPETKVMAFYVEQLENAPEFIKVVKEITRGDNPKPIIMLKSGRTEAGASAIASHTGSLSGGDTAYEALFAQSGVIRANSVNQLFDYSRIFARHNLQSVENISIITNAGGPGVITTDEIITSGLNLAKPSQETRKKLAEFLPAAASTKNPIAILGDAVGDRYQKTLEIVVEDKNTDALLVLLTPQSMTEIEATAQAIVATQKKTDKPILACFMGENTVQPGVKIMKQADIITTTFPEPAAQALAAQNKFTHWQNQENQPAMSFDDVNQAKVKKIFAEAKARGQTSFPEAEALEILEAYGFPVLKTARAESAPEAATVIKKLGGKFAMKIFSHDILHKSDVGGVALNVTAETAEAEYEAMMTRVKKAKPKAKIEGVLLMEMAPQNGIEVILGVNRAPGLGTMLMFGLGGIYVEIFKDVNFAFAPVTEADAKRMINQLQSKPLFEGARGQEPVDQQLLVDSIGRLSQLVTDFPEIVELDINPLLALPGKDGVKMLDARIVLED